jgi:hypothetical protein
MSPLRRSEPERFRQGQGAAQGAAFDNGIAAGIGVSAGVSRSRRCRRARRVLVLTVPIGQPSEAAISDWLRPLS